MRAKPFLIIHVHCPRCDSCLCVRETGSSVDLRWASIARGKSSFRSEVVVSEGVCVENDMNLDEEVTDEVPSREETP